MKNLLKSAMLVLLLVPFFGCESESIDTLDDQSRLNTISSDTAYTFEPAPCADMQSFTKFVNYGSYETDFKVYDSEGNILTSEFLTPDESSNLKPIISIGNVTVSISNSEYAYSKTLSLKSCLLHTFVIDESNSFMMY